jgi:hypothetical protein
LFSGQPVLDRDCTNRIDFYGSCDHNPLGANEILLQKRAVLRDFESE